MHFACRHIKSDGVRCQAPAMRAGNFCYYHTKNRSTARIGVMDDTQSETRSTWAGEGSCFPTLASQRWGTQ